MSLNQRATSCAHLSEDDPTESMVSVDLTTTDDVGNSSNECLRNLVHRIQQVRLPTRGNAAEGSPMIEGLDRVVFGTVSAAEAVSLCGIRPPRYLCYMVSGSLCDVIQFGIDLVLHYIFYIHDASICWVLGFGMSIFFRHSTHRYLVFGNYVGGYYNSLLRMYAGYSITIVLSTIINFLLTKKANISHYHAWIFTLLWTGIVNYFILKRMWSFGGASEAGKKRNRSPLQQEQKQLSDGEGVV
jgi:putative flippase GtrA